MVLWHTETSRLLRPERIWHEIAASVQDITGFDIPVALKEHRTFLAYLFLRPTSAPDNPAAVLPAELGPRVTRCGVCHGRR